MFLFSPLFSLHCHYSLHHWHLLLRCHTFSEVHHQSVQVAGPPPLGPEGHHGDVSLPLLDARTKVCVGAAPAALVVTWHPQGEPGGASPAIPIHLPASGRAGAVGVVTPSVGSDVVTSLTWVYLKSLELKWFNVSTRWYLALHLTFVHLVIFPLVILISLIHPLELRTEICLSLRLPEDKTPPGSLLFVKSWRTLMMMMQVAEDLVRDGVSWHRGVDSWVRSWHPPPISMTGLASVIWIIKISWWLP